MINFIKYWDLSKGRMKQMEHTPRDEEGDCVFTHQQHQAPRTVTTVGNRSQVMNSNTTDRVRFVKCT